MSGIGSEFSLWRDNERLLERGCEIMEEFV
jgi:hypothetical protein